MKILLIGGNGYIGSRLVNHLIEAGNEVIIGSRNPGPNQLKIKPGKDLGLVSNQFDLIINAAGKYSRKEIDEEIKLTFEANTEVCKSISNSINLLSKGVINLSSYFEILSNKSPTRNIFYTQSKIIGNEILKKSCDDNKKYYARLILFDNYCEDLTRGKILDQLVKSLLSNKILEIRNVENMINLLSLDQIMYAIVRIVESFKTSQPLMGDIYLKNPRNYKIIELINLIESISEKKFHFTNLNEALDPEIQKLILEKNVTKYDFKLTDEVPNYLEKILITSL